MQFRITDEEKKRARQPHEILLVNLITNHILFFVALLGIASSYPEYLITVPILSAGILSYLLYRAGRSKDRDSWYVFCHWQLCARRCYWFIWMLVLMVAVIAAGWLAVRMGAMEVLVYALAGVGMLPTMLFVLALIMLESDAMHQIKNGALPKWLVERYPNPDAVIVEESTDL